MALFRYKAAPHSGPAYTGTIEAADKMAVYKDLKAKGDTVISVEEVTSSPKLKKFLSLSWGGVKMQDKISFAKNVSAMLIAGLPLSRALSIISRQTKSKKFKSILENTQDSLNKGQPLSASLRNYPDVFPELMSSMVAAGEESGDLSGSLKIVADQMEKSHALQKKVKGAMMYPAIIIGVMILIAVLMFIYVVPKLTSTFQEFNVELPLATRIVIGISDILQNYSLLVLVAVIAFAVLLRFYMKTPNGKSVVHKLILKIPLIGGIVKEVNSARVTRTLSSLLSSGVDMIGAIQITSEVVQNYHYQEMLKGLVKDVEKGQPLSPIFLSRTELYPLFVGEMVGVGEETGTLAKSLFDVAIFYENEVDQRTKDLSTVIEPFLMVIIGAAVGFFALAMISPIYSMSSAIG